MNAEDLANLRRKIRALNVVHQLMVVVNILVVVVPIWHYFRLDFAFALDAYFFGVIAINAVAFYVSVKVFDRLSYLNKKHNHFHEKLTSTLENTYE